MSLGDRPGKLVANLIYDCFLLHTLTRSDCVQVVIALIVTPDGFPLGYEVLPGNTAECSRAKERMADRQSARSDYKLYST
jgi:hypothetical protein